METTVYQTLRDEMTSYYTALKNFELGQYAIIVVVFSVFTTEKNLAIIAIKAVSIIGFVFMMTKICTELHNKSTRIGSYILVAYELEARRSENHLTNLFECWILANRSSSFRGIRNGEKDESGFRKNLKGFHNRQLVTIIFFWLLTNFLLGSVFLTPNLIISVGAFDILTIVLFEFLSVLFLLLIRKDREESEDYGRKQIMRWQGYFNSRNEFDSHFLSELLSSK